MRTIKEYYVFKEKDWDYYREWPHREKLRFCGRPKFIIQSLVKLYWPEEAKEIFDKFMNGVRYTPNIDVDWASFKAATYVLYRRENNKDDIKEFWTSDDQSLHGEEEECRSYGENIRSQDIW